MKAAIKGVIALIILVIILWIAFWFYAEIHLKQAVEAKIASLNESGVEHVSYSGITTSSSPLVISLKLLDPVLTITSPQAPPVTIHAPYAGMALSLLHPLTLTGLVPLRMNLLVGQDQGAITFGKAVVTNTLTPGVWWGNFSNPVTHTRQDFSNIQILGSNGSIALVRIAKLHIDETINPQTTAQQTAVTFHVAMTDLQVAALFTQLLHLPFNGEITQLNSAITASGPFDMVAFDKQFKQLAPQDRNKFVYTKVHQWASTGGHALLSLTLTVGPSTLNSTATIDFDKQAQPQGRIDINANHLDQFKTSLLSAYPQEADHLNQVQAQLAPYLTTTTDGGQVLGLHVVFSANGTFVNGTRTENAPNSPIIDWNALETTGHLPVEAPYAPGDGSGAALSSPTATPPTATAP